MTYLEVVPSIMEVVGKFFLYYGIGCTLNEFIKDVSHALDKSKFGSSAGKNSKSDDSEENTGEEREAEEDTKNFEQIVPQLSYRFLL